MNTHDIELPPLPYPYDTPAYRTVGAVIQEYTLSTIKADRKRRGEPVGFVTIAAGVPHASVWMTKALSPGKYAIYLEAQPAKPVSVPSDEGIPVLISVLNAAVYKDDATDQATVHKSVLHKVIDLLARYGNTKQEK